uniref:Uncharacterized protein n=1 Tax=Arion vulgaris TaxID=1028688 RepID=A0A0B6ZC04_9EUPU
MKPEAETLTNRLKTTMKSLLEGTTTSCPDYSLIIETDFEHEKYQSKLDEKDPSKSFCKDSCDIFDSEICDKVQTEIKAALKEAAEKEICCQIIYPSDLLLRIAQDILYMSMAEPCGVQGSIIYITLQERDSSVKLATIFGNPSTPPTFEIHLTLREDDKNLLIIQKAYYTVKGCILNSQWTTLPKVLCSAYQLEKRRLYRSSGNETTSHTDKQQL